MSVIREDVHTLVAQHVHTVTGVPVDQVTSDTRFDEDLHADSLDLVEIIEGVERELAKGGVTATIPDAQLVGLRTVGQAIDAITHAAK